MHNSPLPYRSSSSANGQSCLGTTPAAAVQTINITCPLERALNFISDARRWLHWAMPGLQAMQPLPFGQWLLTDAGGLSKLRLRPSALLGALTVELVYPTTGTWPIPVHVLPTPTGCQLVITFHQPAHMSAEDFETCLHNATSGLNMFQLVLEQD